MTSHNIGDITPLYTIDDIIKIHINNTFVYITIHNIGLWQWRNHTWAIVGNAQVALWTAQVSLPSDW